MKTLRQIALSSIATLLVACQSPAGHSDAAAAATVRPLRIATWNLEWLVAPEDFRALARNCVPRGASPGTRKRSLPCDVAADHERATADFDALARYARELDADVIALQEVDGPAAARRVFGGYQFCFSRRTNVQNTGFAIRAGIPHRCGEDFLPLSLGDRLRRGTELVLHPGTPGEIRLLSVHLKSGCGKRPLDSPRDQCEVLARQVPELERWVDAQAAAGRAFAVLGDFNRELLADRGPARNEAGAVRSLWAELNDDQPAGALLVNVAEGQKFVNCSPDQNYGGYIDHVLLSQSLAPRRVPGSFVRLTYEPRDALQRKLSDHCPVGVDLAAAPH